MDAMADRDWDGKPGRQDKVLEDIGSVVRGIGIIRSVLFMIGALYVMLSSMLAGPGGFLKVAVTIGLVGFVVCVLAAINTAFKLIRSRPPAEDQEELDL